jgi:acetyltransferase-like isoleucine patch superfamily enzyme
MTSVFHALWPWRWLRALRWLANGVRVYPSAALIGGKGQLLFGRGTKIGARARIDSRAGGKIYLAEMVWLSTDVEIETDTEVRIGCGTTIQRRCTLNGSTRVGDYCIFAPNVFVSSGTHPFRFIPHLPIREQESRLATDAMRFDRPVWIQDDCWLGVNAVICPGVTVGKGSIVGANAVVTHDVSPYSVVAGAPARAIGRRLVWQPRTIVDPNTEEDAPYVVSGRIIQVDGSGPKVILIEHSTPLRVAVAWPRATAHGLQVRFKAAYPTEVSVGGVQHTLSPGISELVFTKELEICGDICYCNLTLEILCSSASLQILRLEVVSATSGFSQE